MNNYLILTLGVYFCAAIAEFAMNKGNKGLPFFLATAFAIVSGFGYLLYLTK